MVADCWGTIILHTVSGSRVGGVPFTLPAESGSGVCRGSPLHSLYIATHSVAIYLAVSPFLLLMESGSLQGVVEDLPGVPLGLAAGSGSRLSGSHNTLRK